MLLRQEVIIDIVIWGEGDETGPMYYELFVNLTSCIYLKKRNTVQHIDEKI